MVISGWGGGGMRGGGLSHGNIWMFVNLTSVKPSTTGTEKAGGDQGGVGAPFIEGWGEKGSLGMLCPRHPADCS